MALGPRLDLRQSQSLVMTPQLQQAIKLLAASNLELETYIGEALEANPLLEAGGTASEERDEPDDAPREEFDSDRLIAAGEGEGDAPLDLDPAALDRERDTGDGDSGDWSGALSTSGAASGEDYPDLEQLGAAETTLGEYLLAQVGAAARDERQAFVARHIIGLLDDAGYLGFDLDAIAYDLGADRGAVEDALALVQSLDPAGVGARSLAECLAIQAREADRYDPCMAKLIDNLDLLARGEIARLRRMCEVDEEDFADMLRELRGYDPKPGLAFAPSRVDAVVPDVILSANGTGGWDIAINEDTLPRLVVNRSYYVEISTSAADRESQGWLKEKLADAHWLIRALDQRQKTILKTAAEIVRRQDGFFRHGVSELRPLTLREVAEKIEMHESTVSRVTSNKYLACDRGTFELKYFFSSGVASSDGEGASSEAIKARIRALCEAEDPKKILSDQKLADLLKEEGFDLARRTVAKYREAIGIGSSAERRRAKKIAGL
ncbi:RNA polymerase factor sigma-54 [Erythrobacter sp.]|uniref:RNA polymerase factor sigma-54 n=1 Tax=Erythrobacter sp. TaxID=1042 RepID=UPI001425FB82|nr:RNA polymerase factor sigma-54 [Erythrobacter sp.]QIQ87734.1 MAG: RNA polymerase factor sigma-54 [Erythrobacter sp.]